MKMPRARQGTTLYDTRFFVEHFYSRDQNILKLTRAEIEDSKKHEMLVSVITLHEFYRINLEGAGGGRDVARLRTTMIKDSFETVDVSEEIAIRAAELRKRYRVPMGDGLIAATSYARQAICVTDDPHLREIKEIRSRWIS
jgi:predicted nucleic acid-binding protein